MQRKEPSTVNIEEKDKSNFDLLLNDKNSFFYKRDNKEIFIMAMVYGFSNQKRKPLKEKHSGGYFRVEYLTDQEKTLMKAVAVKATGNLEVLLDPKEVYAIAEEYASGGIDYLKSEVFGRHQGDYTKRFGELLTEIHNEIKQ
jgi:hypothetical protein